MHNKTEGVMKVNMKLLVGIFLLAVISGIAENCIPITDINYMFFVPATLLVCRLFKKSESIYKVLISILVVNILYLFVANSFNIELIVYKTLWSIVGGFITFLSILGYKKVFGERSVYEGK